MRVHFIAIGGAAMHNLAMALHDKGHSVSGSDDEIFEPSKTRLAKRGLLPSEMGWHPERITRDLDAVVLGMHARPDNPELLQAQALGVRIYSFPEYLYEQTKDKRRVVVGGSHGKTTITSMIMHILKESDHKLDYLVGAQLAGFETMVGLERDSEIAVFEGDEYLSSPIDRRPKFHLYRPEIAVISGIAWDHINVFPTEEIYADQFRKFVEVIEPEGCLVYYASDPTVDEIAATVRSDIRKRPYTELPYEVAEGRFFLKRNGQRIPLQIFGRHNMQNLAAAKAVCDELSISEDDFYSAVTRFTGAARRLQLLEQNGRTSVYLDFAHSPSKVAATTRAVRDLHPSRTLVACLELHTFSSLNANFLDQYRGSLAPADRAIVYFDPKTVEHKKLQNLDAETVANAFAKQGIAIFTDRQALIDHLRKLQWSESTLLLMSSGTFSGTDIPVLAKEIVQGASQSQ